MLSACGAGNGDGLDANGIPLTENSPPPESSTDDTTGVDLTTLQNQVFGVICAECHAGTNAPQGLRFDTEENTFNFLVGVAANESPDQLRVEPGNADASYLVQKIEGAQGIIGGRMPLNRDPLSAEDIANIRTWITNGAPRTGTGLQTSIVTKVDVDGDELEGTQFTLSFNRELAPSFYQQESVLAEIHYENGLSEIQTITPLPGNTAKNAAVIISEFSEDSLPTGIDIHLNSPQTLSSYDLRQQSIDGDNNNVEGGEFHYDYQF